MPISPFARHHYEQGEAAARNGNTQEVGDHVQAIAQRGTTEDVQDLINQISEAARGN